jgi:hypothetical protein
MKKQNTIIAIMRMGNIHQKPFPNPAQNICSHLLSVVIGIYTVGFEFSAVFSAFWWFLCLFTFLCLSSLTLAHHSPHDRTAVDGTALTWATGFHHFSHLLKVSAISNGIDFLGLLFLVICLFGLQGGSPPF